MAETEIKKINGRAVCDNAAREAVKKMQDVVDSIVVPTKTSELQNDSGYITIAVSTLLNYYLKSEVYAKSETYSNTEIDNFINTLAAQLNAVADSDDVTLDQLSEIVAYIKDNRELIESVTTSKVSVSDIIDNLTTSVSNKPLSAAQGVALKSLIDQIIIPEKLPNPQPLTFTGAVNESYDGSTEKTINIPTGGSGNDSNAVHYTPEERTEEEKAIARENIGAVSTERLARVIYNLTEFPNTAIGDAIISDVAQDKLVSVNAEINGYAYNIKNVTYAEWSNAEHTEIRLCGNNGNSLVWFEWASPSVFYYQNKKYDNIAMYETFIVNITEQSGVLSCNKDANDIFNVLYYPPLLPIVAMFGGEVDGDDIYELGDMLYMQSAKRTDNGGVVVEFLNLSTGDRYYVENYDGVQSVRKESHTSGAVQSDWAQNDSTAPDYVKNRLVYEADPIVIEYDGSSEGMASVSIGNMTYLRLRDIPLEDYEVEGMTVTLFGETAVLAESQTGVDGIAYYSAGVGGYSLYMLNVSVAGVEYDGATFAEVGVYACLRRLSHQNAQPYKLENTPIVKLDSKYIGEIPPEKLEQRTYNLTEFPNADLVNMIESDVERGVAPTISMSADFGDGFLMNVDFRATYIHVLRGMTDEPESIELAGNDGRALYHVDWIDYVENPTAKRIPYQNIAEEPVVSLFVVNVGHNLYEELYSSKSAGSIYEAAKSGAYILAMLNSDMFGGYINILGDMLYLQSSEKTDTTTSVTFLHPATGDKYVVTEQDGTNTVQKIPYTPELPAVTEADEGKVLKVVNGKWTAVEGVLGTQTEEWTFMTEDGANVVKQVVLT